MRTSLIVGWAVLVRSAVLVSSALIVSSAVLVGQAAMAGQPDGPRARQVAADGAVAFRGLITGVSGGANPSYLALRFAGGGSAVLAAGTVTMRVPPQHGVARAFPVTPIPDVGEVAFALSSRDGAPRFFLANAYGTLRHALPACIGEAGVEVLYSNAIAWWCGSRLYVATVTGGAAAIDPPRVYPLPTAPRAEPHSFAADTDAGLVAVRTRAGVTVFTLRGVREFRFALPGAMTVSAMAWSPRGVLAVVAPSAVWLWSRAFGLHRFAATTAPGVNGVVNGVWAPDGVSLLVAAADGRRGGARLFRIARLSWDGTSATVEAGRLGFLLGFSRDGTAVWREEGVASGVYAVPSEPGAGPFRLSLQPLPLIPPAPREPLPPAGWVDMANARLGWMVDAGGEHLLRTTDGGADWVEVTPPGYLLAQFGTLPLAASTGVPFYEPFLGVGATATSFFLQDRHCERAPCYDGWTVGAQPGATDATLLFTADGGGHWTDLHPQGAPFGGAWWQPPLLDFVSPARGWLMLFPCCRGTAGELYRTDDGRRHWQAVLAVPRQQGATAPTVGAVSGVPEGMGFASPTTGWVTGVARGAAWIDATGDGGQTWRPLRLPVPAPYRGALVMTAPPRFLGGGFGVLPVYLPVRMEWVNGFEGYTPFAQQELFVTRDGGATWTPRAVTGYGFRDVLDPAHFWLLTSARLLESVDGGATWRTLSHRSDEAGYPIAFTSATTALGMRGEIAAGGTPGWSDMVRTADGGYIWTPARTFLDCPSGRSVEPATALCMDTADGPGVA